MVYGLTPKEMSGFKGLALSVKGGTEIAQKV
jgi:hypothetical protein